MDRVYIVEGELCDTYGGDYTFQDIWYEMDGNVKRYYRQCFGAKASDVEEINESDIF